MINLVALRIGSEYGILNNQLLCFDPKYRIKIHEDFDHNIIIDIEYNNDFIEGFFGPNVSYITGLVGKNGVGKSTLLRYIRELFIKEQTDLKYRENDLIIFKENDRLKVYLNESQKEKITVRSTELIDWVEVYYRGYPKVYDKIKNLTTVYYSNNLDLEQNEVETVNYYNISSSFLMENIGKINKHLKNKRIRNQNAHSRFRFTELKRQTNFFQQLNSNTQISIPFKKVDKLQLKVKELPNSEYSKLIKTVDELFHGTERERRESPKMILKNLSDFIRTINSNIKDLGKLFSKEKNRFSLHEKPQYLKLLITENLYYHVIKNIIVESEDLLKNFHRVNVYSNALRPVFADVLSTRNLIEQFSRTIKELLFFYNDQLDSNKTDKELKSIQRIVSALNEIQDFEKFIFQFVGFGKPEGNIVNYDTNDSRIDEMLSRYYGTSVNFKFLNFDWPKLSAGEESLIAFFSRLHVVAQDSRNDNMLLLIDEGDLYFHPEWQRKYIYFLLIYLQSHLIDFKNIQIILTTHSPFLVSDLPNENIIFLDREDDQVYIVDSKEKAIETFGGNIHSLYSKAFFMGSSTTSEFAMRKIKHDIIQPIDDRSKEIDLIKVNRLINEVGEPVLKAALLERLKRRLNGSN